MDTLGNRIKDRREALGLSQRVLAEKVGLSHGAVALYETGKREPDLGTLQRLAHTLQTSMAYLVGETDDPMPPSKTSAAAPNREAGVKDGDPIPPDLQLNIERAMLRVLEKWAKEREERGESPK